MRLDWPVRSRCPEQASEQRTDRISHRRRRRTGDGSLTIKRRGLFPTWVLQLWVIHTTIRRSSCRGHLGRARLKSGSVDVDRLTARGSRSLPPSADPLPFTYVEGRSGTAPVCVALEWRLCADEAASTNLLADPMPRRRSVGASEAEPIRDGVCRPGQSGGVEVSDGEEVLDETSDADGCDRVTVHVEDRCTESGYPLGGV